MKISIIGTGKVGSAIAFAAVLKRLADELVLVGRTADSAVGDAVDLLHASGFTQQMDVRSGGVEATAGSQVVVLAAAVKVAGATTRYDAARQNAAMFADLVPRVVRMCPGAIYLVVTNPVDVMTYLTLKHSKLPPGKVFGTGTLIDTARYRTLLAERVEISTHDIRAYILGEHGDSQFPVLSMASAGGQKLDPADPMITELAERASTEGHRVFAAKGYTNYAIAGATAMLLEAITRNSREVFPVSTLVTDYHGISDVCLSVPAVIGRAGIQKVLKVDLAPNEIAQLSASAAVVRGAIKTLQ